MKNLWSVGMNIFLDKTRQLLAENAHQEMYIAENGPILVRADKLLKRAGDKYWKGQTKRGVLQNPFTVFYCRKKVILHIGKAGLDGKIAFRSRPAS